MFLIYVLTVFDLCNLAQTTYTLVQVSDLLDRLYAAFDALADRHGVYKIETIGDGNDLATQKSLCFLTIYHYVMHCGWPYFLRVTLDPQKCCGNSVGNCDC